MPWAGFRRPNWSRYTQNKDTIYDWYYTFIFIPYFQKIAFLKYVHSAHYFGTLGEGGWVGGDALYFELPLLVEKIVIGFVDGQELLPVLFGKE